MLIKKWGRWLVVAMVLGALFMGPVGASDCQAVTTCTMYAWNNVMYLVDVLNWYNEAVIWSYYGFFCDASKDLSLAYENASEAFSYSYQAAVCYDYDEPAFYAYRYTYYVWINMYYAAYYAYLACYYNDLGTYEYAMIYSYDSIYVLYDALRCAIETAFGGIPLDQ